MASRDRRKSFDRTNSNNRQEGAQSNHEAPANDDQPRPSHPLPTSERRQQVGPMRRIEQVISIMTLRRNPQPETPAAIPSPSARRFQPADEPERRFERAFNMPPRRFEAAPEPRKVQQEDQANITLDVQPPQPESSESPQPTTSYTPSRMPNHPDDLWPAQLLLIIILIGMLVYFTYFHCTGSTPPSTGF